MHPIGGPAALAFVEEQLCRAARMRVAVTGATQGVLLHQCSSSLEIWGRNGQRRRPERRERGFAVQQLRQVYLELVALIVDDYDPAIDFFVGVLGFELVEDSPSLTSDGRPKRWVVVRPPTAQTGILLARADGAEQAAAVGRQFAGRVGLFLSVEDLDAAYERMRAAGVQFVSEPRAEPYGRLAVFLDIAGNRWDLLGPAYQ